MAQSSRPLRVSFQECLQDDVPMELCCGLITLNAGIWGGNIWGWLWSGLLALMVTSVALAAFARAQRVVFAR